MRHTKEPWKLHISGDARPHSIIASGWIITEVPHYGYDLNKYPNAKTEQTANAQLMTAAPDLLEALQNALLTLQYVDSIESVYIDNEVLNESIQAIAKAKGEEDEQDK